MRKKIAVLLVLMLVFTLALSACGQDKAPETTAAAETQPQGLGLKDIRLSATTWSSPNGATIHLTAVPNAYAQEQTAAFVVRLEGEELANIPCQWDGTAYTASADLTAENGLCYYVILTEGAETMEIAVNTPTEPRFENYINMADALNSYCSVTLEESSFSGGKLTLSSGTVQVQAPRITNDGQPITCTSATLVLSFNGEDISQQELTLEEADTDGAYHLALSNIELDVPELESDQQLTMRLDVKLSNGQSLTAPGGVWYSSESGVLPAVG